MLSDGMKIPVIFLGKTIQRVRVCVCVFGVSEEPINYQTTTTPYKVQYQQCQ